MTITVIGGGAMGGLWAARLGLAGEENLWVVEKDAERYAAIAEQGAISFHGAAKETRKIPVRVVRQIAELPFSALDGVILAAKAYQVDDVLAMLLPLLDEKTPVLCLANGAGFGGESLLNLWRQQGRTTEYLSKLGQVFFCRVFPGRISCASRRSFCPRGRGGLLGQSSFYLSGLCC